MGLEAISLRRSENKEQSVPTRLTVLTQTPPCWAEVDDQQQVAHSALANVNTIRNIEAWVAKLITSSAVTVRGSKRAG